MSKAVNMILILTMVLILGKFQTNSVSAQTTCEPGQTRTVEVPISAETSAFSTKVTHNVATYMPDPGWTNVSFKVGIVSEWGTSDHWLEYVQANSHIISRQELQEAEKKVGDFLAEYYGSQGYEHAEAHYRQEMAYAYKTVSEITSSHRAIRLHARAEGNGSASGKTSKMNVKLVVSEQCIGANLFGLADFQTNLETQLVMVLGGEPTADSLKPTQVDHPIDAALLHPKGNVFFFRGSQYQRYDFTSRKVDKVGRIGVDGWFGVWNDGMDAAVMHPNGKAYFFRGNQYQRFDFKLDKVDKVGRIGKDGWPGVWDNGMDDALLHPNGKVFFFKGDQYRRYDIKLEKVDKVGQIGKDGWLGVWDNGIAAAVMHPNGKAYFFRGKQYQRYNFTVGVDKVDKVATIGRDGWWGVEPK